ncbi:MAG: diguanylate cyclase [Nitrospinae bacterium]|nr:diguanylate cyclase [Nitrospinota bacterium]
MKGLADRFKVAIIGMGKGGLPLAKMFAEDPDIEIVGVSSRSQDAPGIAWAKQHGIFTTPDFKELFIKLPRIDIVIDATGNPHVGAFLNDLNRPETEVVKGMTANLVWRMVEEREAREQAAKRTLEEQMLLYNIGLMLANAEKSDHALKLIVEAAMDLLEMAAGSAALFDEEKGEMRMSVVMGFRGDKPPLHAWKVRPGGLTAHILSNSQPTVIEELENNPKFDTSHLKDQGFRSLVAVPLKAEGKIVGILYVDDFRPRKFTARELSLMGLLGALAASAVEKVLMLERAEEMAVTDELTKVYNHRYFVRTLLTELKRAERYGEPLGLCMIDVDHFKKFNDTHGHLKGNEVLIEIAKIMRIAMRETDIVARYGGEEFAVILPKTGKDHAMALANRLREAVEEGRFPGAELQPLGKLTVSIGIAAYPDDSATADSVSEIIELADQALYQSKSAGRNRVTACHDK